MHRPTLFYKQCNLLYNRINTCCNAKDQNVKMNFFVYRYTNVAGCLELFIKIFNHGIPTSNSMGISVVI